MRKSIFIVTLLVLVFCTPSAFCGTKSHVQDQYNSFYKVIRNHSMLDALRQDARSRYVQEKYHEIFGSLLGRDDLHSLSLEDLHLLFDAASLASFENPDGTAYKDALAVLAALGSNARDREIRTAQGMLFQSRKPHELRALSLKYAKRGLAEPVQLEVQAIVGVHEILVPKLPGRQLTNKSVDIGHGPKIVVIAHPLCHFTQNATRAIEANPTVRTAMSNHAVWIAPPDRNMDFGAFSEWRDAHPDAPIFVAYSYSSWPEVGEWGTPTFYFFENGRLIHTVVGWPKGGRMNDLKEGLQKIGLVAE